MVFVARNSINRSPIPLHARLSDYQTRLSNLGVTLPNATVTALDALFKGLQNDGLITSSATVGSSDIIQYCNAFAVPVGSAINAILEPLWRPSGTTGVNNGFVSGDLTSAGMISSGTKRYDSGIIPSTAMSSNSGHLSLYLSTFTGGTNYRVIGLKTNPGCYMYYSGNNDLGATFYSDSQQYYRNGLTFTTPVFMIVGKNAGTGEVTINGSTTTFTGLGSVPTTGTLNFGNNPSGTEPVTDRYTWESCGYGLTNAQKAALRSRIQTFNTAIGR